MDKVAIALVPTSIRACSMTWNIWAMPLCDSPSSQPRAGTSWSPKVSSQVAEALMPIFFSRPVANTPFRSPVSSPVCRSKWCLGTMNSDRPLVPGPPTPGANGSAVVAVGRASTRWTMFSVRSCSPAVMNRLTPSRCQDPSGCRYARVRPAPTSEPASGSVSTIVAPHCRSIMIWAIRLSRSVPYAQST